MKIMLRRILLALLVLVVGLFAFLWFGPVSVGNPKALLDFMLGRGIAPPTAAQAASQLRIAPGFRFTVYTADVPLARWLLATPSGDLVVSRTRGDQVVLLARDADGDGHPDATRVLIDGIDHPHGLALRDGWLYVAHMTGIVRLRFDAATGTAASRPEPVVTDFTSNGMHITKTIGFGPDGWLYVSQGSTCNVCIEEDPRRAAITRMQADGSQQEPYATGLRNSVGFDWAPWDGALYATENGRDLLGEDVPPDELNRIEQGGFYGWPHTHGDGIPDPEFAAGHEAEIARAKPPVHSFRAHNAPLGIAFLRGSSLPTGYERSALVALHGSWNRRQPDGYKVVALQWRSDGSIVEHDFLTGFLGDGGLIGRPAGIVQAPDGAIYVADDYAGVIYRIVADPAH